MVSHHTLEPARKSAVQMWLEEQIAAGKRVSERKGRRAPDLTLEDHGKALISTVHRWSSRSKSKDIPGLEMPRLFK